ncbi:unnamed protein product [Eruca vesicaria subsp. sativa]|uniref:C2H2-type domain-containing protein n=1 Tax=Eruca vesicaria subsp. sativa TaxID=29727 RepID=A0ABC8JP00_ERUVS|nr:unnamed protein product [Eruca vesicaria subsp. sativa]
MKQTGEITLACEEETYCFNCSSGCHEKACLDIDEAGEEGSSSLVNVLGKEQEIVKVLSQSSRCCTSPIDLMLSELEVKKKKKMMKKKIKICCKVKTPEVVACGSNKCKERYQKNHIGKSCCRSYAKEYCSHMDHHHHRHAEFFND